MKQTSTNTRSLAAFQERASAARITRELPNVLRPAVRYRLYAGVAIDALVALVASYFAGATLQSSIGLWQGQTEVSSTVDIIGTLRDANRVRELAVAICREHGQTSVYVETVDIVLEDIRPIAVAPVLSSVADYAPTAS